MVIGGQSPGRVTDPRSRSAGRQSPVPPPPSPEGHRRESLHVTLPTADERKDQCVNDDNDGKLDPTDNVFIPAETESADVKVSQRPPETSQIEGVFKTEHTEPTNDPLSLVPDEHEYEDDR